MRSNAYFLAKFRFDTAENETAKIFAKFCKIFATDSPQVLERRGEGRSGAAGDGGPESIAGGLASAPREELVVQTALG